MIRELGTNYSKFTPADNVAAVKMVTGMGAIIDYSGDAPAAKLPAAETAEGIYFVEKERILTGLYAALADTDMDDYFEQFVTVEAGDYVKLIAPQNNEVYGVDQFAAALVAGDKGKRLAVGADGKWKVATVASRFEFIGFRNDGAHKLATIRVMAEAKTNA